MLNSITPSIKVGDPLPEDIGSRVYAVDLSRIRSGDLPTDLVFIKGNCGTALSLLVSGSTPFCAYSGDKLLYQYEPDGQMQRLHVFPLNNLNSDGPELAIGFDIDNRLNRADILIGSSTAIDSISYASNSIAMVLLGMLLLIMLYSLSLYAAKPSEKYLAILAGVTALTTLVFLNDMSLPLISLPRWFSEIIRNFSQIGTNYMFAFVTLALCRIKLAPKMAVFNERTVQYVIFALLVLFCLLTDQIAAIEPFARVLFIVFMCLALAWCEAPIQPGTRLLIMGYGAFNALGACFDIIKQLTIVSSGMLPVLVRLPQLGSLVFLCCATVNINFRFAGKFSETQHLALELDTLNQSLDSKVEERTRQLEEQQEQKHRLMLNIFHDLRSPVFVIQGALRKQKSDPQSTDEQLALISDRINFIDNLSEDLFTVAKLEENDLLLAMDVMDFSAMCYDQCKAAAVTAAERGISFAYRLTDGVSVWGDELRLEQAFQNLLTNAITYTPIGGTITVKMTVENGVCTLTVKDTGRGISPDDLPHIFSRYYRVDRAVNSKSTGLGLSIASEMIELHKGTLTVESLQGVGTTFKITLQVLE